MSERVLLEEEECLKHWEVCGKEEQDACQRLYQRMVVDSNPAKGSEVTIRTDFFVEKLEVNPNILRLFCVREHIPWPTFLMIFSLFFLRKEVKETRVSYLLKLLNIRSLAELQDEKHMIKRVNLLKTKPSARLEYTPVMQRVWDHVRTEVILMDGFEETELKQRLLKSMDSELLKAFFDELFEIK